MENIFQPNDKFDFSHISLAHPTGIQGGAYFTKIQMHNKPLYIETPKSLTRQGFVKNGKKIYCDLMFDNNDSQFIHWLENLENKCQELIHSKGESWFENKLELNDIETAFACPIRIYKSGKYYLVRVNVKVNYNTNIPSIKIYNENELPITIDDVTSENYMISILEIQGIKFTSRNFQIEMELKQAMVLSSEKIFESCLIKTSLKTVKPQEMQSENIVLKENAVENLEESELVLETQTVVAEENQPEPFSESPNIGAVEKHDIVESVENKIEDTLKNEDNLDLNLTEVNLDSDLENLETITLKKPNQVYYEIYKTARKKAKDAKRTAIMAFLEAKNIKKTYMLDDLDDSEDSEDSDMDIEDMSEEDLDSDLEKEVSED
jgi:hypothetical protein|uniref:Uncharacterized protein n=1 Tax=viral metagenome TaxID=1070528 RepID=A0A6C0HRN1_9ZZZZ